MPNDELVQELEELDREDHQQRPRIVLADDQMDQETADDGDRHQNTKQPCADLGFVCEHEGTKEHEECQEMDAAALHAHPSDVVCDSPGEDDVETPPGRQEQIRLGMLDHASRMQIACPGLVEDRINDVAAATEGERPVQM